MHHATGPQAFPVERLEARLNQDSTPSSRPPSSDSSDKKPRRRTSSSTQVLVDAVSSFFHGRQPHLAWLQ